MLTTERPTPRLVDLVLYVSSALGTHPRPIDRYIDYFGGSPSRAGRSGPESSAERRAHVDARSPSSILPRWP
jgi:hypothetical protein